MNRGLKLRITIFIATIASLLMLIAWTAHISWQETGELHEKLSTEQWKVFHIADHLEQSVLGLNNLVLRYAAYRDPQDWTNFVATSTELKLWINQQQSTLASPKERPFLDQIDSAFDDYVAAANALTVRIYSTHRTITRVVEFTEFERQSKRVLDLGFQLATAHQETLDSLQAQTAKSLAALRFTLFGSLILLLGAGGWLAAVVYRDMISPLQVQLVESRQLVERQEKLVSLGMLAAGVAHEIRNPLTAIKAWLYMQQKRLSPGTPEYADAQLIGGEINRLERIVRDFLLFARPSDPRMAVVPAEQPLTEVRTLLLPELEKSRIQLVLDDVAAVQIQVDLQQIKQVLINLIQNAADSIGENGTITLRARLDEKRLFDRQTSVVILEVCDTGRGIPAEVEKRLFDPFFTTKDSGTGLGLPIAARIVEKHRGALQYQTQAGHGTTFGVILPLYKP
jgi:signal transduction histidine kinase